MFIRNTCGVLQSKNVARSDLDPLLTYFKPYYLNEILAT